MFRRTLVLALVLMQVAPASECPLHLCLAPDGELHLESGGDACSRCREAHLPLPDSGACDFGGGDLSCCTGESVDLDTPLHNSGQCKDRCCGHQDLVEAAIAVCVDTAPVAAPVAQRGGEAVLAAGQCRCVHFPVSHQPHPAVVSATGTRSITQNAMAIERAVACAHLPAPQVDHSPLSPDWQHAGWHQGTQPLVALGTIVLLC